jgi:serine/threonine protein kinase
MTRRAGEYILEEKIGQGTFGEVWKARHHVWSDRVIAVKIPTDPQYLRALQREGSAIHGLQHPNIVRAVGFDPYADPPYLAMEYVPGTSLRPLIGKIPVEEGIGYLKQVLSALAFAHKNGVIHRDVKPENVLIDNGVAKLTDFGLGKSFVAEGGANSIVYSASLNSAAGGVVGTMAYMSPEVKAGSPADARADIYACGVMLFELLTGERPAGTEVPSDLKAGLSHAYDDIFRRSYSRLEKRYATADEFLDALNRAGSGYTNATAAASVAPNRSCARCHGWIEPDDQFCIHCGLRLAASIRRCGKCGAYPDCSDQYCIFCGHGLSPRANVEETRVG